MCRYHIILTDKEIIPEDSSPKHKSFETIDELKEELLGYEYTMLYLWWYNEIPESFWYSDSLIEKDRLINKALLKIVNTNKIVKSSLVFGHTHHVFLLNTCSSS